MKWPGSKFYAQIIQHILPIKHRLVYLWDEFFFPRRLPSVWAIQMSRRWPLHIDSVPVWWSTWLWRWVNYVFFEFDLYFTNQKNAFIPIFHFTHFEHLKKLTIDHFFSWFFFLADMMKIQSCAQLVINLFWYWLFNCLHKCLIVYLKLFSAKRPPVEETASFLQSLLASHGPNYLEKLFGSKARDALQPLGGVEKVAIALSESQTIEDFGAALHLMRFVCS